MWRDLSIIARTSKMILICKSKNADKNCIEQFMRKYNVEYLFVVKSNKTFNSKFCYPKYFIMDSDALNELLSNDEYSKVDLVIEELVPHSENYIIKIHWFPDKTILWRMKISLPESDAATNVWLNKDIRNRSFKESHGSMCYDSKELVQTEDKFDLIIIHKIWTKLMKTI